MAPAPPMMVYPVNGATNVQDGGFTLVLSAQMSPVQLAIGSVIVYPKLQPAPVPNPLPSPATLPPSPLLAGYAVGTLQPASTYDVIAPIPQSGCYPANAAPSPRPGVIGRFTTQ